MNRRACLRLGSVAPAALAVALTVAEARAQEAHPAAPNAPATTSAPNAPTPPASPGAPTPPAAPGTGSAGTRGGGGEHDANGSPAAASASAASAPATSPGPDTSLDVLRTHDVVQRLVAANGSSVRAGYAATIVHRPAAEIVSAIHDVDHYRDFVPQFEQSQELRRGVNSQDLFVRITVAHVAHLWARLRYRESSGTDGSVVIDGHALEGNVSRMDVRWRMTPIDGGVNTVVEFWTLVLPAIALPVPDSLLEGEQQSAARRGVVAVRHRVEPTAAVASSEAPHP